MSITRRQLLQSTGGAAIAALASAPLSEVYASVLAEEFGGYGPLQADPAGVLDLPVGFEYRIIARSGEMMTDGVRRPSLPDGMAAFPGPGGTIVLCCNHENDATSGTKYPAIKTGDAYDVKRAGGTTAMIVSRERQVLLQYTTSAGTGRNCAGGATPWGTWLTCEEVDDANHGYVFEVDPLRAVSRRLPALGRFRHEAVAFDPRTNILYLTEDQDDSMLYRFRPAEGTTTRFEAGVLEALVIRDFPARPDIRRPYEVAWAAIPTSDPQVGKASTRAQGRALGGVRFRRGEGACYTAGSIYFAATTGGAKSLGQIWRLTPGATGDTLELWAESTNKLDMELPDNIVMSPSGDLMVCEDGDGTDRLLGITPAGKYFEIAKVRGSDSEVAGVCWAPDGQTLFFNIFDPGFTVAVTGPFRQPPAGGAIARTLPPPHLEPRVPHDYLMAALDRGYGKLEAAALHRLGLPLA